MALRLRLTTLFFLEFATWGAYLTSMGSFLASRGLGDTIGYFYSVQGWVSIFMPTLFGILADRRIEAQRLLGLSHLLSGVLMMCVCWVGLSSPELDFGDIFPLYALAVAFYMPTLGLSNSVAYTAMEGSGLDRVSDFPRIRIFGTIGFLVSMWAVDLLGFQRSAWQFMVSGSWGVLLGLYSFTLPRCGVRVGGERVGWRERWGFDAFGLMRSRRMFTFFLFSMLLGVSLQITNGYAGPYISSFGALEEYRGSFFAEHANILISLSQMSETLCILLIPFFLKRYGIKAVMVISMCAWFLRFGFFGVGSPVMPGVLALVASMVVYGVAFDFFNISGSLFVDSEVEASRRSSAQGLFMLMTNGLGAAIGTLGAQAVVNHFVYGASDAVGQMEGWRISWLIFAGYSAVVCLAFVLSFRRGKVVG